MPLERERHPDDWSTISLGIKAAANWCCQNCGRPCRMPGERLEDFADRISAHPSWIDELLKEVTDEESGEHAFVPICYQQFTLTTAHLNQNPADNSPHNLTALCAPCHLNHDRPYRNQNRMSKRERQGQMTINLFTEPKGKSC